MKWNNTIKTWVSPVNTTKNMKVMTHSFVCCRSFWHFSTWPPRLDSWPCTRRLRGRCQTLELSAECRLRWLSSVGLPCWSHCCVNRKPGAIKHIMVMRYLFNLIKYTYLFGLSLTQAVKCYNILHNKPRYENLLQNF